MRVLVNAISARRGGIVTYTENLIAALAQRGVKAIVAVPPEIAASHGESALPTNASAYSPIRRFLWEQIAWRRLVRRIAPDVLFSSANFGLLACPVPQLLLVREGGLFDPFYLVNSAPAQGARRAVERYFRRWLILMSAHRTDRVMTPSLAMRDALLLWAPELANRCTVNPYGTLPAFYQAESRARPWREDGVLRLLYVSVYYPHKNPAVICAALDRLNRDGLASHATITMDLDETGIPGGSLDRIALADAVRKGAVTLGHRDYRALPALYSAHDVFVFPSVSETFGHPMAEALAAGLPIVAADTAINREICGTAALYFSPFSPTGLADAIRRLDADAALRARMSEAATARARAYFDWDAHADRLVALLEQVAACGPGRRGGGLPG